MKFIAIVFALFSANAAAAYEMNPMLRGPGQNGVLIKEQKPSLPEHSPPYCYDDSDCNTPGGCNTGGHNYGSNGNPYYECQETGGYGEPQTLPPAPDPEVFPTEPPAEDSLSGPGQNEVLIMEQKQDHTLPEHTPPYCHDDNDCTDPGSDLYCQGCDLTTIYGHTGSGANAQDYGQCACTPGGDPQQDGSGGGLPTLPPAEASLSVE